MTRFFYIFSKLPGGIILLDVPSQKFPHSSDAFYMYTRLRDCDFYVMNSENKRHIVAILNSQVANHTNDLRNGNFELKCTEWLLWKVFMHN